MRLRICSYRWLEEQLSAPRLTASMMSWTPSTCHPPAKWVAKWLDWYHRVRIVGKVSRSADVSFGLCLHAKTNSNLPTLFDYIYNHKDNCKNTPTIYLLLVPPECATVLCELLRTWFKYFVWQTSAPSGCVTTIPSYSHMHMAVALPENKNRKPF